jgi:protein phosphatase-4 regulatory subunit 3
MRLHWCEDPFSSVARSFYSGFFDKHFHTSSCPPKGSAGSTSGSVGVDTMVEQHSAKTEILLNICELLCFCVRHHYHRMK